MLTVQRVIQTRTRAAQGVREVGREHLPMSLTLLVQVPVTLGIFFGMEHLCALPSRAVPLERRLIPSRSHSSRPILRLTQGLYTVSICEIYMIQVYFTYRYSKQTGKHATRDRGEWERRVGKASREAGRKSSPRLLNYYKKNSKTRDSHPESNQDAGICSRHEVR